MWLGRKASVGLCVLFEVRPPKGGVFFEVGGPNSGSFGSGSFAREKRGRSLGLF